MARIAQELDSIVLVGIQELQYTPEEIDKLEGLCSSMQLRASRPRPYCRDVLSALDDCKIFHFAGHGSTDPVDPSRSSLHLADGPLTVANLFESNLHAHPPFLAYLSACRTGQITHDGLIDEGLHLIGAYQLAGFRHAIGTLWEVNDRSCVDVATMTYEWMKNRKMSDESVSGGLHYALRRLRGVWISENAARRALKHENGVQNAKVDQILKPSQSQRKERDARDIESYNNTPIYWVPFVHFGI
ncbi:hypothetical protein V2G26_012219 [Clonostachys chloroleuca]